MSNLLQSSLRWLNGLLVFIRQRTKPTIFSALGKMEFGPWTFQMFSKPDDLAKKVKSGIIWLNKRIPGFYNLSVRMISAFASLHKNATYRWLMSCLMLIAAIAQMCSEIKKVM